MSSDDDLAAELAYVAYNIELGCVCRHARSEAAFDTAEQLHPKLLHGRNSRCASSRVY